jgi:hypothetical protein
VVDDRALVQGETQAVAELDAEGGAFAREAEVFGRGPDAGDRRGPAEPGASAGWAAIGGVSLSLVESIVSGRCGFAVGALSL